MVSIEDGESRRRRALYALPMLGLSAVMIRAAIIARPCGPVFDNIIETRQFDMGGVTSPIITVFWGIPLLDEIYAHITVAFAQMQFFSDPVLYWQSLVFLTDYAGMYAILLLESFRRAPKSALFQYPFIFTQLSQVVPIGITGPVFFFFFYVLTPMAKFKTAGSRVMSSGYAAAVLPTIVLTYYIPHFSSYLHLSLQMRNWWNWVWQPYPVWGAVVLFLFSKMSAPKHDLPTIKFTVGAIAVVNTAVYWYTLYASDLPLLDIILPKYLLDSPQDPAVALRTTIQFDFVCSFSAGYLWLAYHFWDLKAAGICSASWIRILGTALVTGIAFGPGAVLLLGWIVREELLASLDKPKLRLRKNN